MRVPAGLSSLELVVVERNGIPLVVLVYLAKYVTRTCFRSIGFHPKCCLPVIIFQDRCGGKHSLKCLKGLTCFLIKHEGRSYLTFLCSLYKVYQGRSYLRKALDKASVEPCESQEY